MPNLVANGRKFWPITPSGRRLTAEWWPVIAAVGILNSRSLLQEHLVFKGQRKFPPDGPQPSSSPAPVPMAQDLMSPPQTSFCVSTQVYSSRPKSPRGFCLKEGKRGQPPPPPAVPPSPVRRQLPSNRFGNRQNLPPNRCPSVGIHNRHCSWDPPSATVPPKAHVNISGTH